MDAAATGTPTLVGVGVGPGDPELVTRKAVAVFERADVILVPTTETSGDDAGRAEQIVLAACPDAASKLRRVPFSMAQRRGVGAAAHGLLRELGGHRRVADEVGVDGVLAVEQPHEDGEAGRPV